MATTHRSQLLLPLLCLDTLIATTHGNILRWVMRCWYWKFPRNNACGCRCHVSDNVKAEAYFHFNTGMPTLAPTEPLFEFNNERNKPSLRLGFEVLLKSLRFSPCGPQSAAPNKRGFVRSAAEAWVKPIGQAFLCWILGGPMSQSSLSLAQFTSKFAQTDTETERTHTHTGTGIGGANTHTHAPHTYTRTHTSSSHSLLFIGIRYYLVQARTPCNAAEITSGVSSGDVTAQEETPQNLGLFFYPTEPSF